MQLSDRHQQYWHRNLGLTLVLLAIWFIATFVVGWFARDLQGITILGFPLPFYMGAQGSPLVYLLITGCYAFGMDWLDRKYGVAEREE